MRDKIGVGREKEREEVLLRVRFLLVLSTDVCFFAILGGVAA
jgi:hypothetical protein